MTGGDVVADVLVRHRVAFLFTLCGGHISPILVSAKARGIRVVDTRHEATAVFAADAVARLTGVPGVAAVTAGPGVTNTITALKNAQLAQSPLVLLGGATATLLRGRGALQDIDQLALVRPHVKRATRVTRLRDLRPALETALRICREGVPGPVFVECPVDLLYPEALVREWYGAKTGGSARGLADRARHWYVERHLARLFGEGGVPPAGAPEPVAAPAPDAAQVARAAHLLARAERPVLLVGSQALASAAEADRLAAAVRTLGVPVFLSGMARGLLGRDDPLQLRHKRKEALREADLVILAGVPCDFRLDYGAHIGRGARLVSANRSRDEIRKNRRPTLAALCAPELFLRDLAGTSAGPRPQWATWRETLRARDAARDQEIASQAAAATPGGVNPLGRVPCARGDARGRERDRRRRRRLRRVGLLRAAPAPARCRGWTRAPSGRSAWARGSRSPRSWCAPTPTSGSSTATARSASAWSRRTPSRATASASSRSSATTPRGRRSRASRSRC